MRAWANSIYFAGKVQDPSYYYTLQHTNQSNKQSINQSINQSIIDQTLYCTLSMYPLTHGPTQSTSPARCKILPITTPYNTPINQTIIHSIIHSPNPLAYPIIAPSNPWANSIYFAGKVQDPSYYYTLQHTIKQSINQSITKLSQHVLSMHPLTHGPTRSTSPARCNFTSTATRSSIYDTLTIRPSNLSRNPLTNIFYQYIISIYYICTSFEVLSMSLHPLTHGPTRSTSSATCNFTSTATRSSIYDTLTIRPSNLSRNPLTNIFYQYIISIYYICTSFEVLSMSMYPLTHGQLV